MKYSISKPLLLRICLAYYDLLYPGYVFSIHWCPWNALLPDYMVLLAVLQANGACILQESGSEEGAEHQREKASKSLANIGQWADVKGILDLAILKARFEAQSGRPAQAIRYVSQFFEFLCLLCWHRQKLSTHFDEGLCTEYLKSWDSTHCAWNLMEGLQYCWIDPKSMMFLSYNSKTWAKERPQSKYYNLDWLLSIHSKLLILHLPKVARRRRLPTR